MRRVQKPFDSTYPKYFLYLYSCTCTFLFLRDLRARLEVTVAQVSEIMMEAAESQTSDETEDYASDSEGAPVVLCNVRITTAVRKKLAMAIKDLIEHGLTQASI